MNERDESCFRLPPGNTSPLGGGFSTGGPPPLLGVPDVTVARNAYGRQRESFEATIAASAIDPAPFPVAFIRAPVVMRVGHGVRVLGTHDGRPVLVQQSRLLASSFHPEITRFPACTATSAGSWRKPSPPARGDEAGRSALHGVTERALLVHEDMMDALRPRGSSPALPSDGRRRRSAGVARSGDCPGPHSVV